MHNSDAPTFLPKKNSCPYTKKEPRFKAKETQTRLLDPHPFKRFTVT